MKSEESPNPLPVIDKLFLEIEEFSQGANIALESNEWEGCTMDITEWNLLLALLNKLKAVEKFYKSLLSHGVARTSHPVDYSVKTLKLKGKGILYFAFFYIISKIALSGSNFVIVFKEVNF